MLVGAVGFIDVLGFKGIWKRYAGDPGRVLQKLRRIEQKIDEVSQMFTETHIKRGVKPERIPKVRVIFISDSIFLTAGHAQEFPDSVKLALGAVVLLVSQVMLYGLQNEDVPLVYRGVISTGQFLADDDRPFVVGPAIDEAASLESLAQGAFVWLAPSAADVYAGMREEDSLDLRDHSVPLKGIGDYSTWAVDPIIDSDTPGAMPFPTRIGYVRRLLDAMTTDAVDTRVKRDNTMAFYSRLIYEADQLHTQEPTAHEPATDTEPEAP